MGSHSCPLELELAVTTPSVESGRGRISKAGSEAHSLGRLLLEPSHHAVRKLKQPRGETCAERNRVLASSTTCTERAAPQLQVTHLSFHKSSGHSLPKPCAHSRFVSKMNDCYYFKTLHLGELITLARFKRRRCGSRVRDFSQAPSPHPPFRPPHDFTLCLA